MLPHTEKSSLSIDCIVTTLTVSFYDLSYYNNTLASINFGSNFSLLEAFNYIIYAIHTYLLCFSFLICL